MSRLLFLIPLLCLPFWTAGQDCGVKVKANDQKTYDQALELYGQQYYTDASKLMRRVAQRNPKAADPQFWLGMLAVDNGFNITGIRKYFTKCISLCEDYPDARAHYYMGMIHYTDERYEEATTEFNRYFQLANGSDRREWTALYEEASAYLHWSQFLADAELHRVPFDPEPLRGVSSKRNEDLPYLTPDRRRCYYLRELPAKRDRTNFYTSTTEKTVWKLFYSDWSDKDSAFDSGHELPAPFNQGSSEGAVSTTADGEELYFARMTKGNSDIYCAKWEERSGKWKVERLGNGINGDGTWESQPSVSVDGRWLLFASNRQGGQGGSDLWRCHRLSNGDWSRPENLGSRVNTEGNEKFPFLHADGHTLYFVSDGWQGFGGYDVYFIDLRGDSYPTNLGLPINSEDDNLSFGVTTDGHQAYFPGRVASSRSKDILFFDLDPAARPEPMRLCEIKMDTEKGLPNGPRDTLLMLSEKNTNVVTFAVDGHLPTIRCGKARDLDRIYIMISDSVSRMDLSDPRVLDALAAWLIEHPRVHLSLECPKTDDAKAAYNYLTREKKLRTERLTYRGGTAIETKQIKLTTEH